MKICADCKHFDCIYGNTGICLNPKLDADIEALADDELGLHDQSSGFSVGIRFGCIHWDGQVH